jgi:hypothetical protein
MCRDRACAQFGRFAHEHLAPAPAAPAAPADGADDADGSGPDD